MPVAHHAMIRVPGRRAAFLLAQGLRGDACDAAGERSGARALDPRLSAALRRVSRRCRARRRATRGRAPLSLGGGARGLPDAVRPAGRADRLVGGGGGGGRLRLLRGQGRADAGPDLALDEQRRALLCALVVAAPAVLGIEESCTGHSATGGSPRPRRTSLSAAGYRTAVRCARRRGRGALRARARSRCRTGWSEVAEIRLGDGDADAHRPRAARPARCRSTPASSSGAEG